MASTFHGRLPYLLLIAIILMLDRWSKALIQARVGLNQTISVIDGFFNITYVQNTGVAFGILDPVNLPAKSALLSLLTAGAVAAVIVFSFRNPLTNRLLQTALSLIFAGAVGNLYDRLRYGFVVDFLEFYYRSYHWPSFNVADAAISTGVALLALEILVNDSSTKTPSKA